MEVSSINQLETDIEHLVQTVQRLSLENMGLKQQLRQAEDAVNKLQGMQQQAATGVRQVIKRLKEQMA